jgi:probable HAF family extracellular repeat protein
MKRQILSLAVVMAFLCPAGLRAEIAYKVTELGTLPGKTRSNAYSINDAGQIVGEAYVTSMDLQYLSRATLFGTTGAGNNIDLGTLGGNRSLAYCINDGGQIVGWADSQMNTHATLFDPTGEGKNIDLATRGGRYSWASSINDASQIVGHEDGHATLFDRTGAGNNIDLGTLGGGSSWAYSINNAGQIVGQADGRATLFDPTGAGNNIDLGTIAGYGYSCASSINEVGQIVGEARYGEECSEWEYRACIFDVTGAGKNIDLGTLGGDESRAESINDAGQIVGSAQNSEGDFRATLFDPTGAGNNIDLNTLIDPASGWTLWWANDINNSGCIVGQGINPQGQAHAFLLVPKPPCLYALAGDLNDDCKVDFADLAVMAANWLVDCGLVPTDPACVPK